MEIKNINEIIDALENLNENFLNLLRRMLWIFIEFTHAIHTHWPRPSRVRVYKTVNIDRISIFTPLLVFKTAASLVFQLHGNPGHSCVTDYCSSREQPITYCDWYLDSIRVLDSNTVQLLPMKSHN